jgi:hypothetical protein
MVRKLSLEVEDKLVLNNFFFFFDNLGCSGQRFVDMRTSINLRGTRNTLLAYVS